MKKKLFLGLLAAAAVTFTACQKDEVINEVPQDQAIEFGTYVGRDAMTKGSIVELDEVKTGGFGVYAYYTEESDFSTPGALPNFMNNTKVTYDTDWEYSPLKYWPNENGHKISFFAYAPYDANKTLSATNYSPIITYEVDNDITKHTDILYANAVKNQTKQIINGKVKFEFFHALSRIGFNVEAVVDEVNADNDLSEDSGSDNTNDIDANTEIVVKSVTLSGNFIPEGTLDLANSTGVNNTSNTPSWDSETATPKTFTLDKDNFKSPTTSPSTEGQKVTKEKAQLNDDNDYLMIIPQNFNSDQVNISIVYEVKTTDNTNNANSSVIENTISKSFNFNFEAGKAYMFNLHIGMTSVKVDADVEEWDESEKTLNIPINTTNP